MGCSSEMRTRKENDGGQAMIEERSKRNRGAVGGDAGRGGLVRRADWNGGRATEKWAGGGKDGLTDGARRRQKNWKCECDEVRPAETHKRHKDRHKRQSCLVASGCLRMSESSAGRETRGGSGRK